VNKDKPKFNGKSKSQDQGQAMETKGPPVEPQIRKHRPKGPKKQDKKPHACLILKPT
jgi:hypothetical protein